MANLVVRNIKKTVVDALKKRAVQHGISAEAEHRIILEETLLITNKKTFAEILVSMPNVGTDEDFTRIEDKQDTSNVFD